MKKYQEYMEKNKDRLFEKARRRGNYSEDGHLLLEKSDPWMQETFWDVYFARVDASGDGEKRRVAN